MFFRTVFCLCMILGLASPAFTAPATLEKNEPVILRQVILMRHGVRAPTQSSATLESWSDRQWPEWPVQQAYLTPRGAELVSAFWAAQKKQLVAQGLLPADRCPTSNELYVHADVDERTRATAAAVLKGLVPDCSLAYSVTNKKADPLFNAVKAGAARYDSKALHEAIPPAKLQQLRDENAEALALLQEITHCCAPSLCKSYGIQAPCTMTDLPISLHVKGKGEAANIRGSMSVASGVAEIMLLEFAQWPEKNAGWGMVDEAVLKRILGAHSSTFFLLNSSLPAAQARGGTMLTAIRNQLLADSAPRLTMYVGHDTNLANISGLLGLEWDLPGYPHNATPPGSALIFSLRLLPDGSKDITVDFTAYTLKALHEPVADSGKASQSSIITVRVPLFQPVCSPAQFDRFVQERLKQH